MLFNAADPIQLQMFQLKFNLKIGSSLAQSLFVVLISYVWPGGYIVKQQNFHTRRHPIILC